MRPPTGNTLRLFVRILAGIMAVSAASSVFAQSNCRALVQVKTELWFAQADGKPVKQLTNDGRMKYAAAVSPNGNVIAYSGKPSPNDLTLIDSSGRLLADIDLHAVDAITGLSWVGPSTLRIQEHIGPRSSKFLFAYVPTSPIAPPSLMPVHGAVGVRCAPRKGVLACMEGDTITLKARSIYSLSSPFESSIEVQNLKLALGTSVLTSTTPPFRLELKTISNQTFLLRVTSADGQWQEMYVEGGDTMRVKLPPNTSDGAPVMYGVQPSKTNDNPGVVSLSIKFSKSGEFSYESDPVWDPSGSRIAFVEKNDAGNRWLVVVNSQLGVAAQDKGALDGRRLLPIKGPVSAVSFPSATRIRVTGQTDTYELEVPAHGKISDNAAYTVSLALPKQLAVTIGSSTNSTPVLGWVCR